MKSTVIEDILNLDINNLRNKQHEVLKEFVIGKLREVIRMVEEEEYESILSEGDILEYSPSGDYMGEDNHYINFNYTNNNANHMDIEQIVSKLKRLKEEK